MSKSYLKRDFPDLDSEQIDLRSKPRLSMVLFIATHGMWLAASLAGLILSVTDARPEPAAMEVASRMVEIR